MWCQQFVVFNMIGGSLFGSNKKRDPQPQTATYKTIGLIVDDEQEIGVWKTLANHESLLTSPAK